MQVLIVICFVMKLIIESITISFHPHEMSFDNRIDCLLNLKAIGFQTGCGFMVGSYHQDIDCLVNDLLFIKS